MKNAFEYRRDTLQSKILGKAVQYGVFKPVASVPIRETFYLLHGGNGDDQQFQQLGSIDRLSPKIQQALSDRGAQVILPFVGTSCLHAHPEGGSRDYSQYFFEELIPLVEAGTRTESSSRWIGGLSMGGHAALNAFLRFPKQFAGAGAHFPTLIGFNLWDDSACDSYRQRTGVEAGWFDVLRGGLLAEFTGPEDYASHDPIRLASSVSTNELHGKPVYFDVGSRDAFGLQEGCEAFSMLLRQRGIAHEYHLVDGGGHDADFVHARFERMMTFLLGLDGAKASLEAGARLQPEAGVSETRA